MHRIIYDAICSFWSYSIFCSSSNANSFKHREPGNWYLLLFAFSLLSVYVVSLVVQFKKSHPSDHFVYDLFHLNSTILIINHPCVTTLTIEEYGKWLITSCFYFFLLSWANEIEAYHSSIYLVQDLFILELFHFVNCYQLRITLRID